MEVIKDDYIRKIEAVKILQKAYTEGRIKAKDGCVSVLDDINALPKADVQPVKRGRWVKDEKGTLHHCSECGGKTFRDVDSWGLECQEYCTDYCPHCGARMIEDGDTNERS